MLAAAAFFLLLADPATRVQLVDEVYRIPTGEWRYIPLSLNQRGALVSARFDVQGGAPEVRLALMRAGELRRLRTDRPHGFLASTRTGVSGELNFPVREQGNYAIVIVNRDAAALQPRDAAVHVAVSLDFADAGASVSLLTPRRRLTVILVSFAVFFGIVTWSARRLLSAMKRSG